MKKLRALIVDEQGAAFDGLVRLLETHCPEVDIVGGAHCVRDALNLITSLSPDIIFLDVYLPEGNGFDLVEAAGENNCSLVFVTGHHDYAALAFRVDAIDYLLKPVSYKELRVAVSRAGLRREKEKTGIVGPEHRVRISTSAGMQFIACRDIVNIEAEGRYSIIHTIDREKQLVSRNIGEFEEELEPHGFFRVHKSWLINCLHVVRLTNVDGGTLELTNGTKVLLARRKKVEFLKRMDK